MSKYKILYEKCSKERVRISERSKRLEKENKELERNVIYHQNELFEFQNNKFGLLNGGMVIGERGIGTTQRMVPQKLA